MVWLVTGNWNLVTDCNLQTAHCKLAALWNAAFDTMPCPVHTPCPMRTVILLLVSNIFMTFAWYGHLKFRESPLWLAIIASWGIAFVEYCFQVPANRIGSYQFSGAQLKTIQEVITLVVFSVFSVVYLKEQLRWNYLLGFGLIVAAVFVIFKKW